MNRSLSEPSGQAASVIGPGVIVSGPLEAAGSPVTYSPERLLQSAFAVNVLSSLNVIV